MKTVFVINPMAGSEDRTKELTRKINELLEDTEIYITKSEGDAKRFVEEYCKNYAPARFIACGGDGTLGEVLNGAILYPDTEVGVIPMGTGNDFCRNFTEVGDFKDIKAQIKGKAQKCDAVFYRTTSDEQERTGYCVNMFNIGFDCNVADMTATMKKKPFISGSLAYLLSIFAILIKKKGAKLKIELDGEEKYSGELLLTSVANGCFCGGGVKSNPLAFVNDGLMNVNIIYNISRLNFLTKLPFYMKGTHINLKNIEKVIFSVDCKKAVITPLDGTMRICVDGEIINASRTEFEILHNAFNFVVPAQEAVCYEKVLK